MGLYCIIFSWVKTLTDSFHPLSLSKRNKLPGYLKIITFCVLWKIRSQLLRVYYYLQMFQCFQEYKSRNMSVGHTRSVCTHVIHFHMMGCTSNALWVCHTEDTVSSNVMVC